MLRMREIEIEPHRDKAARGDGRPPRRSPVTGLYALRTFPGFRPHGPLGVAVNARAGFFGGAQALQSPIARLRGTLTKMTAQDAFTRANASLAARRWRAVRWRAGRWRWVA